MRKDLRIAPIYKATYSANNYPLKDKAAAAPIETKAQSTQTEKPKVGSSRDIVAGSELRSH